MMGSTKKDGHTTGKIRILPEKIITGGINRRDFLKVAGIATGSVLATRCVPPVVTRATSTPIGSPGSTPTKEIEHTKMSEGFPYLVIGISIAKNPALPLMEELVVTYANNGLLPSYNTHLDIYKFTWDRDRGIATRTENKTIFPLQAGEKRDYKSPYLRFQEGASYKIIAVIYDLLMDPFPGRLDLTVNWAYDRHIAVGCTRTGNCLTVLTPIS
jgi:hypothetical protein